MSAPLAKQLFRNFLSGAALALLVFAIVVAVNMVDWTVLAQVSWWVWPVMVTLVILNLLLASLMFWVVTLSFDAQPQVSLWRMTQLVTASALLNFLPFRPGLIGRAAHLKAHHALPLRQSVLILLVVLATGTAVSLGMGLLALMLPNPWQLAGSLFVSMIALSLFTGPVASKLLGRKMILPVLWIPIRVADALVASARVWLAFWVMGQTLDVRQAIIAGTAGLLVAMVGLTPNGLGLKEWVIALIAQTLAVSTVQIGLAASLVDRGIESIVVVLLGTGAILLLRPWMAANKKQADS